MRHPLHSLGKKNRNIISGILVGIASIFLIMFYLDIPSNVLIDFLIAVFLLLLGIIVLAVCFVLLIKGIRRLFTRNSDAENQSSSDSE